MKFAPSLSPTQQMVPPRLQQWLPQEEAAAANLRCFPVSKKDDESYHHHEPRINRQLFRSLDVVDDDNNSGGIAGHLGGVQPPVLMSPLPLRSSSCCSSLLLQATAKEFTPPPSPFGRRTPNNNNNNNNRSFGTNSFRTAETESIASSSSSFGGSTPTSSTATTPRSSPNSTTTMNRPRISSLVGLSPCGFQQQQQGCQNPSSPSAFRSNVHRCSVYDRHPPKPFSTTNNKPKKKHRYLPSTTTNNNDGTTDNQSRKKTVSPFSNKETAASSTITPPSKNRLQKVKTELCLYYSAGEKCPFGANCHYAHGEHELQSKRLLALQELGLIEDAFTYRIKPCFSHVAMGSCPFGKRCACIHDPRITGTVQSWLPITETQGNNITTDINVEGLHQKRRFDILYGDPFFRGESSDSRAAQQHKSETTYRGCDWKDLYNRIADISNNSNNYNSSSSNYYYNSNNNRHTSKSASRYRRKRGIKANHIRQVHKLSIAIQMHGGTHRWMYKYRPTHTIFNELCMVLNKRAFKLEQDRAIPLPIAKYRSGNPNHCIVREIAFGPDGDPSVRPVALWFNISEEKVTECTLHKQKLFRWHKHKQLQPKATTTTSSSNNNADGFRMVSSSSPFDSYDSFVMVRPIDREAFCLVQSILEHRFASLGAESISSIRERSSTLERLRKEHAHLGERFSNLKNHWAAWAYPSTLGRPSIDEQTPVPPADTIYDTGRDTVQEEPTNRCFRESRKVWASFLSTLEYLKKGDDDDNDDNTQDRAPKKFSPEASSSLPSYLMGDFARDERVQKPGSRSQRLSVFVRLSHGQAVNQNNRSLPHIKKHNNKPSCNGETTTTTPEPAKPQESYSRQSERCWKSLLLEHDGLQETEWNAVVDHFTNSSRSQKVLNIVQQ